MKRFILLLGLVFVLLAANTLATDATRQNSQANYSFNTSQYLSFASAGINQTSFTVNIWFQLKANSTSDNLFEYQGFGNTISGSFLTDGDEFARGLRMSCSSCSDTFLSGSQTYNISVNQTYMVTFMFNGTHMIGYLNGTFLLSDDTITGINQSSGTVYINGFSNHAKADIYKVEIYNRSLSSSEIATNFNKDYNTFTDNQNDLIYQFMIFDSDSAPYGNSSHVFNIIQYADQGNVTFNFSSYDKNLSFEYGLQDMDKQRFNTSSIETLIDDVGTERDKIWISFCYSTGYCTIPIGSDPTTYDYANLTSAINRSLNQGRKLMVMFAQVPPAFLENGGSGVDGGSNNARDDDFPNNAANISNYANYTANVVGYIKNLCNTGGLSCGNFSDTFWWEIHSEVTTSSFFGNPMNYSILYNQSYHAIKGNVSDATVCSAAHIYLSGNFMIDAFYKNITSDIYPDCVSFNVYDNSYIADINSSQYQEPLNEWFDYRQQYLYFDSLNAYINTPLSYKNNTKLVLGEWQMDSQSPTSRFLTLGDKYHDASGVWMANSLYWMMKTNLTGEFTFYGTTTNQTSNNNYGMWLRNGTVKSQYTVKANWTQRFNDGSLIRFGNNDNDWLLGMATDDHAELHNTYSQNMTGNITFYGKVLTRLYDQDGNSISFTTDSSNTYFSVSLTPSQTILLDYGTTLYVNASQAACSDAYSSGTASNPSTPWCGSNTTWLTAPVSGDVVLVDTISREPNGNGWVINRNLTGISYIATTRTNFTAAYSNPESGSCTWNLQATLGDGSKLYNTTCISTGTTFVGGFYLPLNISLLNSPNLVNLSQTGPYWPNYSCFWNSTPDVMYCKTPADVDPNNGGFAFAKAPVFTLTGSDGFNLTGGTCIAATYCLYTLSGTNGLFYQDAVTVGGMNDNGAHRITSATDVYIDNWTYHRQDQEAQGVWWDLIKGGSTNTELSAIKFDTVTNFAVTNSHINGSFNGIVMIDSTNGTITGNTIVDIMDDCTEPEGDVANLTIFNNTCLNVFHGLSATPANSTKGYSNFSFNVIQANRSIPYHSMTSRITGGPIKAQNALGMVGWYVHNNDLIGGRGLDCNAVGNSMQNVTFYNNIGYTYDDYIQGCTGLQKDGVSHDYWLYYRTDSGGLSRYVNSTSDSTIYSDLSSLLAAMPLWNQNSIHADPLFTNETVNNYQPYYNSPVRGTGLYGIYIGALAPSGENITVVVQDSNCSATRDNSEIAITNLTKRLAFIPLIIVAGLVVFILGYLFMDTSKEANVDLKTLFTVVIVIVVIGIIASLGIDVIDEVNCS